MARRLFALLPEDLAEPILFAAPGGGGWRFAEAGDIRIEKRDEVTVFAPGPSISLFEVALPARNEAEARRAAPYAVEDELAQPVDMIHAALGPRSQTPGAPRRIAVTSRALMADWLERLSEAGCANAALVPEQALPPPDEPILVDLGDRIVASFGDRRFAIDAGLPLDVHAALLGELPEEIEIHGSALARRLSRSAAAEAPEGREAWLTVLIGWFETADNVPNLRQGAFAAARRFDASGLRPWRASAVLAGGVAAAAAAAAMVETRALDEVSRGLESQALSLYRSFAPEDQNISAAQAAATMRRTGRDMAASRLDFVTATAALYAATAEVEGAEIRSLRLDADTARLVANMAYGDYGDDARLKDALETAGLAAAIGDSRQAEGRVLGDVILEPGR